MEHRILLSLQIMKEQQFHKIQIHFVMQLIWESGTSPTV